MSKTNIYTRTGSKAQARQIYKLSKQIAAVRRTTKDITTWEKYQYSSSAASTSYPGTFFKLIAPDLWNPIFNAYRAPNAILGGEYPTKAKVGNIQVKGIVQIEAGDQVVTVDLYVVRLKADTCMSTLTDTGNINNLFDKEDLPSTNARFNGQYFSQTGTATLEGRHQMFLNKKAFTTIAHRQFQVANQSYTTTAISDDENPVTNIADANKPFSFFIKNNFELEVPTTLATEDKKSWKTMDTSDITPTDQIYLLAFNNAVEGAAIFMDWNMVVDVREAIR